jgi:hypothetical protein
MLDITEISAVVAAAGVLVAVVYYLLDVRNQAMMRKTELITRLYSHLYGSEDLQRARKKVNSITYEDYDDFVKKYGAPNSEEPTPMAIATVLYVFEEAGVLLSKKLVDVDLIDQLMGDSILRTGTNLMPFIEEARKRINRPRVWTNFEYLYNEMKKREQKLQKSKA